MTKKKKVVLRTQSRRSEKKRARNPSPEELRPKEDRGLSPSVAILDEQLVQGITSF